MGDRPSSSRQDTTSRSSRDASSHSRMIDLTRRFSQISGRNDTVGQGGSSSGHPRSFTIHDARQPNAGYVDLTDDATGQGASGSGYDPHASKRSDAGNYARSNMTQREITLLKEYYRKNKANRAYHGENIITQEERSACNKYSKLTSEYRRQYQETISSTGVSEHTRPPSRRSSEYDRTPTTYDESPTRQETGQLRLTESETKRREEQEEWLRKQYSDMGLDYDEYKGL